MRVLCCGSRSWDAPAMVYSTLDALHAQFGDSLELVCGMARGADSHAARWAHNHGVKLHEFPADWRRFVRGGA